MVKSMGIIVQAHMGSTRLPGKVLKQLYDKSVLGHILTRLKNVKNVDALIVATSDLPQDNAVAAECEKYNIAYYRGSDSNVLSRFYEAARLFKLTDVIRVCSDNVLIDWEIINQQIGLYQSDAYEIVTTGETIPLGLGGEIFSYQKLKEAFENASKAYHEEHVTPYIYEHCQKICKYQVKNKYVHYRFTLDTEEDWCLVKEIYGKLYRGKHNFLLEDVDRIMKVHPYMSKINKKIKQRPVK